MGNQKSTTSSGRELASITTTGNTTAVPPRVRRIVQNFLLIWLDANIDESKKDFKYSLAQLRRIVTSIRTYTDAEECMQFMKEIKEEKIFLIISGSLGQHIVPKIDGWTQLDSIYVYCSNQSIHEQWAKTMSKVKAIYTDIDSICKALQIDRERCDRALIPISFRGIDASFMYTQLFKEALLEIDDDDDTKSIKELVEYCRFHDEISQDEIERVEREYRDHTPIWWYTAPYFIYSMLNRGLRLLDVDIILRMGFFIRHLHQHIEKLHREQQATTTTAKTAPFQVYRGQGLSMQYFEKMKQATGELMSFNNFLSTSYNRNIALNNFAYPAALNPNTVGILFVMTIDPTLCVTAAIPFVNVKTVGFYEDYEEEILFSTHTIFRIDKIEPIDDKHTDRLWQVYLILTGNDNNDFNVLTEGLRKESGWSTGWPRLGHILIRAGEYAKAEQLYQILLEKAVSDIERKKLYSSTWFDL